MAGWFDALRRTRKNISSGLGRLFAGHADEDAIEDLEEVLVKADVAPRLAMEWIERLEACREAPDEAMRALLLESLGPSEPLDWHGGSKPFAVLIVGVNGAGKTTTCAKLAWMVARQGMKPLLGAADTFRAAGSEQLRIWADMVACDVVTGATGADAAAVAFDALDAAIARDVDVLFLDTAGRMHTKQPLMQELEKVKRAMGKRLPGAPHETWVILDASMGQNAIEQARVFHRATPLTGAVITKLDGSSKAGFVFSVRKELGIPIRLVGLGEGKEDLAPFTPEAFVDALLGLEPQSAV
ncbi:MAG: signal recognition particle-docking protein FtsY [Spartobacteria bacterium]|nr:signal recognition particle-docking protein FtsY [Spartobacteria bacterium]